MKGFFARNAGKRRPIVAALLAICALLAPQAGAQALESGKSLPFREYVEAPTIVGYPDSIASTGDSITRAFNTGGVPFTDAPANSWSTGSNSAVVSHYTRIVADHPPAEGRTYNDAATGAIMADLNGQLSEAVAQEAHYVTILVGANDACADTEAEMTPVALYRTQFEAAMSTLSAGLPDSRIYVLSVPDIYNLWFILKDNGSARFTWSLLGICQSMLANPLSNDPEDVARRNRVRNRVIDYNTQLREVCARYVHCRYDNNAVFNTDFVPGDVSTRDYFHPSIPGQAKIAGVTYAAGFDFKDGVAPSSTASLGYGASPANYLVTITSVDNVGVAGVEYKIDKGAYTRYTGPVNLPTGSTLRYRAVDVNGTVEETRVLSP